MSKKYNKYIGSYATKNTSPKQIPLQTNQTKIVTEAMK
jgi:hypothetical protein